MSLKQLSLLILASMPLHLWADGEVGGSAAGLSLPSERVVTSTMARDEKSFALLQQRMNRLNSEKGIALDSYGMAKAQAWWDLANAEYRMNDRSDYVRAVLAEVDRLLVLMETDQPMDLSRIEPKPAQPLRADLWQAVADLKAAPAFACAAANTAQLEVMLAGAGHDYDELGWRHAVPRIARAERLLKLAKADLEDVICQPKPEPAPIIEPEVLPSPVAEPPVTIVQDSPQATPEPVLDPKPEIAPVAAPAKPMPEPIPQPEPSVVTYPDRVHFAFNSSLLSLRSQELLLPWVDLLRARPDLAVELVGHSDLQGQEASNEKLSAQRVQAVKEFFLAGGIALKRMQTQAQGMRSPTSLQAAENRRVELRLRGDTLGIRLTYQQQDLQ